MVRRIVLFVLLLVAAGCGVQQIAPANRKLMLGLQSDAWASKEEHQFFQDIADSRRTALPKNLEHRQLARSGVLLFRPRHRRQHSRR